jgi:hypothetical protein
MTPGVPCITFGVHFSLHHRSSRTEGSHPCGCIHRLCKLLRILTQPVHHARASRSHGNSAVEPVSVLASSGWVKQHLPVGPQIGTQIVLWGGNSILWRSSWLLALGSYRAVKAQGGKPPRPDWAGQLSTLGPGEGYFKSSGREAGDRRVGPLTCPGQPRRSRGRLCASALRRALTDELPVTHAQSGTDPPPRCRMDRHLSSGVLKTSRGPSSGLGPS